MRVSKEDSISSKLQITAFTNWTNPFIDKKHPLQKIIDGIYEKIL